MKIPTTVRQLYAEQLDPNRRLQAKVDEDLKVHATRRRWHYESRIKNEISVALKLESGRVRDPHHIEDFFACTLVVRNLAEIADAEGLVGDRFTIAERRPENPSHTRKRSDSFPFDDVRLYAHWKDDPALPPSGLDQIRFEVQIKTFLQHAWGIATHDLVYKTDDISWSRERIAYQIKAMLEHAEISIQEADMLAGATALAMDHTNTEELRGIIAFLKEVWAPEFLPDDLRRLAVNTQTVMRMAGVRLARLRDLVEVERQRQKGSFSVNISPYAIIVQAAVWQEVAAMKKALADRNRREKLFVTAEMDVPARMAEPDVVNIVRV